MAAHYSFVPAPPETLPKDGWQFAAQTLTLLKSAYHDKHASTDRFNERLELAEQYRIFDRLPTPEQPYGSLDAMLQAEIGASKDEAVATKLREKAGNPHNSNSSQRIIKGGANSQYRRARLERDRPDILEAFNRGEYRSLRQAAIAGGIEKERSNLEKAQKAFEKLTKDERETFLIWVSEQ